MLEYVFRDDAQLDAAFGVAYSTHPSAILLPVRGQLQLLVTAHTQAKLKREQSNWECCCRVLSHICMQVSLPESCLSTKDTNSSLYLPYQP